MNTVLTPEEFINELKPKIAKKKEELLLSEFWELISKQPVATENL